MVYVMVKSLFSTLASNIAPWKPPEGFATDENEDGAIDEHMMEEFGNASQVVLLMAGDPKFTVDVSLATDDVRDRFEFWKLLGKPPL